MWCFIGRPMQARVDAKNGLESYLYNVKAQLGDGALAEKMGESIKEDLLRTVEVRLGMAMSCWARVMRGWRAACCTW